MSIKIINFNSLVYKELLSLRNDILRKPLGLNFSKEDLEEEVNQYHFAYFENDKILGGLILLPSKNGKIKMRQVCVAENMQGKSIGNQLVLFAENWAKEKGFSEIYCHARKNAIPFYAKLNYEIVGNIFLEVGLEHFKLVKQI